VNYNSIGETGPKHFDLELARLDAGFVFFAAGMSVPEIAEPVRAQLEAVKAAIDAHGNGRNYSNFTEEKTDTATFYGAATYARLRAVKSVYDPGNLFRANHEIPPAA
jgi:FAD/FMN-containing dehydrogenase